MSSMLCDLCEKFTFLRHLGVIFETNRGFHRAFTPVAAGYQHNWCSIFVSRFLSSLGIDSGLDETEAAPHVLFDNNKLVEHQILKINDSCLLFINSLVATNIFDTHLQPGVHKFCGSLISELVYSKINVGPLPFPTGLRLIIGLLVEP